MQHYLIQYNLFIQWCSSTNVFTLIQVKQISSPNFRTLKISLKENKTNDAN